MCQLFFFKYLISLIYELLLFYIYDVIKQT